MKTYTQINWTGAKSLEVSECGESINHRATVSLEMTCWPMRFSEHLTPEQAIDFAAALVEFATAIQEKEKVQA